MTMTKILTMLTPIHAKSIWGQIRSQYNILFHMGPSTIEENGPHARSQPQCFGGNRFFLQIKLTNLGATNCFRGQLAAYVNTYIHKLK